MDHIEEPHKPDEPRKRPPLTRDRDESSQSGYYYDDSTNYEIYHDESDEGDEDDCGSQAPAARNCRNAS